MNDDTDDDFGDEPTPGELLEVAIKADEAADRVSAEAEAKRKELLAVEQRQTAAESEAERAAHALRIAMQAAGVEALLRGGQVYYVTAAGLTRRRL